MFCPKCLSENCKEVFARRNRVVPRTVFAAVLQLLNTQITQKNEAEKGTRYQCNDCGHAWYPKLEAMYDRRYRYILDLLGTYDSMRYPIVDGLHFILSKNEVTIRITETKGCIVPLHEIAVVEYRDSLGPLPGRLSIRDRAHFKKPFPKDYKAAKKDRFTVFFDPINQVLYRRIAQALKGIAEENKKEGLF